MAAVTSNNNITASTAAAGAPREPAASETYHDKEHAESTLKSLYGCFQSQELCDVTLVAGECRISAHRVVLAACSAYFRAVFSGRLQEAQLTETVIDKADSRALQELVQYCYTGAIELREETAEKLLSTARLMQINRVANACCVYLRKHLDPHNCLRIALLSEQQACAELHEEAVKCTLKHLVQVMTQQEFLALQPDQLTSLLTSADLDAATVQSAFESLIAWVQHDAANREQHLAAALKLLKLHLLPTEYLLNNVARECSNVPECMPLIVDALRRRLAEPPSSSAPPASSALPASSGPPASLAQTGPSCSTVGRLYAIGGDDVISVQMSIEMYSAESSAWRPVQGVKGTGRHWFGGAVLHGKVIVVGGRNNQLTLINTAESFELSDTLDGDWSTLAPLNTARRFSSAAALGDGPDASLYVVGGQDDSGQRLRSVERWDARAGAWTLVAPMKDARDMCGLAALSGRLYAVGGWHKDALSSVECYDPNTNCWSDCAPMSRARDDVSVCAAGGYLYAIGGGTVTSLASVERYDPVADTWAPVAPLSHARHGVASCLMGDQIVAVGGVDSSSHYTRTVEVYDLASDRWQELAPLNTARRRAVLAYVPPC